MATFAGRRWSLDVNTERIDITSDRKSPNERWHATDSHGDEHHYDRGYPTLDLIVDAEHWCDGHEGLFNHDPHMAIDESHYECKVCREIIEPAFDPPYTPKFIPGLDDAKLTGLRPDGTQVTAWLTADELAAIRAAGANVDSVVARIIDELPIERVIRYEYTR